MSTTTTIQETNTIPSLETLSVDVVTGITAHLPGHLREKISDATRADLRQQIREAEFSQWWTLAESAIVRVFSKLCLTVDEFGDAEDNVERAIAADIPCFLNESEASDFAQKVFRLSQTLVNMHICSVSRPPPFSTKRHRNSYDWSGNSDSEDSKSIDYPETPDSDTLTDPEFLQ